MTSRVVQSAGRIKISLVFAIGVLLASCASRQGQEGELTPEEYQVINDFFQRAHRPLYHRTINSDLSPTFSDYDSIAQRKRYPERTRDYVLEHLLRPETLRQIQEKSEQNREIYFEEQYLSHVQLTRKKRNSLTISRPIVLDSIAIILKTGVTKKPVFIHKKDPEGNTDLRYTII